MAVLVPDQRPRADQAHLPAQHVDELGQLVERAPPKPPADPRHPGVGTDLEQPFGFVSIDGLYRAVGEAGRNDACPSHCDACFTGDYPTRLTDFAEAGGDCAQLSLHVDKVA